MKLENKHLDGFREYLEGEEKSGATTAKYLRDARAFGVFADGKEIRKALGLEW